MYSIPAARTYDWATYCGIPGGIPTRTTIYATMTTANSAAEINTAIANCPSGQVVYLAAGTYELGSTRLVPYSGVTIRGAGAGQTIIHSSTTNAIRRDMYSFVEANGIAISSGYTAGSMAIVLASTPSAYMTAGNHIALAEDSSVNKWDTGIGDYVREGLTSTAPSLTASRCHRFTARIESVVGNTVNLAAPIPASFTAGLTPKAYPLNGAAQLSLAGVEDMTFEACADPIRLYGTDRCWFLNLDFDSCPGCDSGHIQLSNSVQPEVRRCYIHDVDGWPEVSEGAGFGALFGTSNGLFIDNITNRTSLAFCLNAPVACAFIHNYSRDCTRWYDPPGVVMPQFQYHGPLGLMNLFEGNIGPGYCPDGYHGSASHDTLFRNHFNGLCTGRSGDRRVLNLSRGSYYESVVGNIIGDVSWNFTGYEGSGAFAHADSFAYVLGYPNSGNVSMTPEYVFTTTDETDFPGTYPDAAVESTLIRHANYDYYSDSIYEWADADHDIADGIFYTSKPDFFGGLEWPAIDPFTPTANSIPAKWRWDTYVQSGSLDDIFADIPAVDEESFTLTIVPVTQTKSKGAIASFVCTVNATEGFTGNVTLAVEGLPAGVTPSFSTNPVGPDGTSTLTIPTSDLDVATHSLTLTGEEA